MSESKRPISAPAQRILNDLDAAREHVREEERQFEQLQQELAVARSEQQRLNALLDEERERARCYRRRSEALRDDVTRIHASLFSGSVHQLILRVCMNLTGARHGIYVTAHGVGDLRIRAQAGFETPLPKQPSARIAALCAHVLSTNEAVNLTQWTGRADLPDGRSGESRFENGVATPVVLRTNLNGVIIVADKEGSNFDADDMETLLSVGSHAAVAMRNQRLERELQSAYLSTVSMLADAMEAKDPFTHGHCEQTSRYARLIATRMALSDQQQAVVCYAALLHDIGKIGVSDGVLHKPGTLLPEEMGLMRSHARVGHDLLRAVPALGDVAEVVLHHHEWYDGSGYPDGLLADAIPIESRIVSAVDAYCAMITRRSYKEAYTDAHARNELKRCAGTQFDPEIVRVFLDVLDSPEGRDQDEDYDAECGLLPTFVHLRQQPDTTA